MTTSQFLLVPKTTPVEVKALSWKGDNNAAADKQKLLLQLVDSGPAGPHTAFSVCVRSLNAR